MERHVSRPLWIIAAVVVCALAIGAAGAPAFAGGNPNVKAAVHIKAHPTSCTKGYPTFTTCSGITTTWANTGDIDAMPVFFDLVQYVAVGFGLDWPAEWGSASWIKCRGDLAVGTIADPGDGTGITWTACQSTWSVAPGAAWLAATGPGRVDIIADPATGDLGVVDCAPSPGPYLDYCVATYSAGVGGATGDNPCVVPIVPLTLAKTDNIGSTDCVFPGGGITYTLAYTNPNSSAVNSVVLTDSLPADVDYVSSTGGGVYNGGSHTVVWSLGTVAGSGSGSVTVDVTADPAVAPDAALVNNCWIVSTETPTRKTATLTTRVCACNIDGVDTVCPGSKVQFCAPTGMTSYAWSVTGNGTVFGISNQRCVTIWAGTTCGQDYTVHLTVLDPYGITSVCAKDVAVGDAEAPVISGCPADVQVQCLSQVPAPNIAAVVYSDNCSNVTVTHQGDVQSGTCVGPDAITITRTYRATDLCGLYDECVQTITVDDTTPPTITGFPGGASFGCLSEVPAADPGLVSATDNCGTATVNWQQDQLTGQECSGTLWRTYRVTDGCGNYVDSIQTFLIQDSTDPVFTSQCPADTSVECDEVPAAPTMTASDECDTAVNVAFDEQRTDGACPEEYTLVRTWTATDDCGNQDQCIQTISVADRAAPNFHHFPPDQNLQCVTDLPAPDLGLLAATDNCSGVTITWKEDIVYGTDCNGRVERTYRATDDCGNAKDEIQTFTILDTTDPYFTSQCPADVTVECDDVPAAPTMTAADGCDSDVAVTFDEQRIDGTCAYAYTLVRTWTATDDCLNDVQCVQTITATDTEAPGIVCAADGRVACGAPIVFTDPTVTDNCDPSPTLNDLGETSTPGPGAGEVTHTKCWTATDACGNTSGQCCQNIIEETCEYERLTLVKTDNSENCVRPGDDIIYTITYGNPNATDVNEVVLTDTIPSFTDYVASNGGGVWNRLTGVVTWSLGTLSGSAGGAVQLTVSIRGDTPPAVVIGNGCEIVSAETSPTTYHLDTPVCACLITGPTAVCPYKSYEFCGPEGMTSYAWTISGDGEITSPLDARCVQVEAGPQPGVLAGSQGVPMCEYDYTLHLTAGEPLGGTSSCDLAVQGRDGTAPEITCPPSVDFQCSAIGDGGTATATDNCDDSPLINYADNVVPGVGPGCYMIERTWTASDDCGNSSQCVQNIVILDSTPPEITCAPDARIGCGDPLVFTEPTASDLCNTDPLISVVSTDTVWVPTTGEFEYTRCWEASDGCGNSSIRCCQTITREACSFVPLRITKDDGLTVPAAPGDTITYAIAVYNDNLVEVTAVTVVDELPGQVSFVSATGAHVYDASDHDVVWEIPSIAGAGSVVVTLAVEVDPQMASDYIENTASASCPQVIGSVEALEVTQIVSAKLGVYLDIKPGFCPNPLNPLGTGQVQVAVVGTADLDVTQINVSSLQLGREGEPTTVAPVSSSIVDVATPFTGDLCGCTTAGADGYPDLLLRFSNIELFSFLHLNDVKGRYVELILTGALTSGTEIVGRDCARIMGKAQNQGLGILMAPKDTGFIAGAQIGMAGGEISLAFTLADAGHVQVDIFDVQGRLVKRLVDSSMEAGDHSVAWNVTDSSGRRVPMGIYFARLATAEMHTTKKLVVVE